MEKSKMKILSSRDNSDKISSESDTITIPGLAELSQRVGENTSDIKYLKERSEVVTKMDARITGIEAKQDLFEKKLDKLDLNDSVITKAIQDTADALRKDSKQFKIWLVGIVFASLTFGLTWYLNDKKDLKQSLTTKIYSVEKNSKDRHSEVNKKLDKITDHLMK